MTLQSLISRARVKMLMNVRRYTPPRHECFDMVVDSLGIRFSTTYKTSFCSASIVSLDYADETRRTIDSVLLGE